MNVKDIINRAKTALNLKDDELASKLGITREHLSRIKGGTRDLTKSLAGKLSKLTGIPLGEILGEEAPAIPVIGSIDAGAFVTLFDTPLANHYIGYNLSRGADSDNLAALVCKGDIIRPFLMEEDIIIFEKNEASVRADILDGFPALVKLADGRTLIREIHKSAVKAGTYNLLLAGTPAIENAVLIWAAKIILIQKKS